MLLSLLACTPDAPVRPPASSPAGSTTTTTTTTTTDGPPPCVGEAPLRINEVSAANTTVWTDEHGDSVDWIEIHNPEPEAVELAGWTLSDDRDEPQKWTFPSWTLEAGGYLVVPASGIGRATPAGSWDARVDVGDLWRYTEAQVDAAWTSPTYDDGAWAEGPSGFGRGDEDDATVIDGSTAYVRTTVEIGADELADLVAMVLHVDYDDGFVAYLNGVEVARDEVGLSGVPPAWTDLAKHEHEALLYQGLAPEPHDLADAIPLLVAGENTLAVEVHNRATDSLDLTLIPILSLGFASERAGRTSAAVNVVTTELHTNFSLRADGEVVTLTDPSGCTVDELDPGRMYRDQSYGRTDGGLGYFVEPTPGAQNTTEARPGFADAPELSPPQGAYPGGVDVQASVDPAATVRVAWGGAEPTEADPAYDGGPMPTGTDGEAVVVRARAWVDGLWPSEIATATYLLRDPGTLPIVSVVTDPVNLWDPDTGIYVLGDSYEPEPPFYGANYWEDWEKPVHLAMWETDGTEAFAVDAGVSIHGGYSRAHEQKNLLVQLRSGYGDDEIEHEVFPGLGIDTFGRMLLRAAGNDWHGCFVTGCSEGGHLRDALMHRIAADSGLDVMAYRPTEVYLNGEYWGVYEIRERPDVEYLEGHYGTAEVDYLEMEGKPIEGDGVDYQATLEWLRTHDLSDPANYAYVDTQIDLAEYATYLAYEVFYANTDWPGNNAKYWRPRTPDGRWRWFLYDTDFGLGDAELSSADTLAAALEPAGPNWPNPPWSTELFRLMMTSPEFEVLFVNTYADHLNTLLTPEATQGALHDMQGDLAPVMPRQVDRWGEYTDGVTTYVMDDGAWEKAIGEIDTWLGERPAFARTHLQTDLGLGATWTLQLDVEPGGAGTFDLTAVNVTGPFAGTYFQGVPVTVTAVPAPGWTFTGWTDPLLGDQPTLVLDPITTTASLVAVFE